MNNQNNLIQRRGQGWRAFLGDPPDADANVSDHTELRAWFSANFWRENTTSHYWHRKAAIRFISCVVVTGVGVTALLSGWFAGEIITRPVFFYTGVMKRVVFQELELLCANVPFRFTGGRSRSAAYQKKRGLTYQADILIERIRA